MNDRTITGEQTISIGTNKHWNDQTGTDGGGGGGLARDAPTCQTCLPPHLPPPHPPTRWGRLEKIVLIANFEDRLVPSHPIVVVVITPDRLIVEQALCLEGRQASMGVRQEQVRAPLIHPEWQGQATGRGWALLPCILPTHDLQFPSL